MKKNPAETIEVSTPRFACDGGGGALGHPKVFLTVDTHGEVNCPYCGKHFVLAKGAKAAAGH